jgi:uncharacterized protein (TIGR03084 family)
MDDVLADLAAEQDDVESLVAELADDGWDTPTPAKGWCIRDQISHLAYFDQQAALSARDPEAFMASVNEVLAEGPDALMERHLSRGRALAPAELLAWWQEARAELQEALGSVDPGARLPWYGPPMKARSSAVARLMETWAHGADVADALGVVREPTDRLFHIAELGVKTFSWSFQNRGLEVPSEKVRVALRGPSGRVRVWNDEATASVTGPVEDFCLVVAQRRHIADTHLVIEGVTAARWMEVAQVFAGPPGPGRPPTVD